MILYMEEQLSEMYQVYRQCHMEHGSAYLNPEDFRILYERMMTVVYNYEVLDDED